VKPVQQKVLGPPGGDCLRACVASILELDIDELPNFHGDGWWDRWVAWGEARGLDFCCYAPEDLPPEAEYWIAGPDSPRIPDVKHAVVVNGGEIVWDPHPDADPEHPCDLATSEDAIAIWSIPAVAA
jgi:hypothetical protein